jgi:hypothetical protein
MEFMLKNNLSSKFGIVMDGGLFNYEQILHAYQFLVGFLCVHHELSCHSKPMLECSCVNLKLFYLPK